MRIGSTFIMYEMRCFMNLEVCRIFQFCVIINIRSGKVEYCAPVIFL